MPFGAARVGCAVLCGSTLILFQACRSDASVPMCSLRLETQSGVSGSPLYFSPICWSPAAPERLIVPLEAVKRIAVVEHTHGCNVLQELAGMATVSVVRDDDVVLPAIRPASDYAKDLPPAAETPFQSSTVPTRRMDPATAGVYAQFVADSWVGLYKTLINPPDTTVTHQPIVASSLPMAVAIEMPPL